jgi:hypothetical protein
MTGASAEVVTVAANGSASTITGSSIVYSEIGLDFTSDNAADSFTGGTGNDNVNVPGGTGVATIALGAGTSDTITVTGADLDATGDTLTGIEKVVLGDLDLTIDAADLATNALTSVTGDAGGALGLLKVSGTTGVDSIDVSAITTTTNAAVAVTAGNGLDTITTAATGAVRIVTGSAAANADTVVAFTSGTDVLDIGAAWTAAGATLTIPGSAVAAGGAANTGAAITAVTTAANTDADVFYVDNEGSSALTLTQIETAITAGNNATGEMILILDDGTNTKVYFDAAAQTDASGGAGLILLATLNGLTGVALATNDIYAT